MEKKKRKNSIQYSATGEGGRKAEGKNELPVRGGDERGEGGIKDRLIRGGKGGRASEKEETK